MSKHLEAGKYYNLILEDKNLGEYRIPFKTKSIKATSLEDDESEPQNVKSDKPFRRADGTLDYNKYEFEHYIETSFDLNYESEIIDGDFIVITKYDKIKKAKASIKNHLAYQADYDEAMASKYPEY